MQSSLGGVMRLLGILCALTILTTLNACGPSKSNLEAEEEQIELNIAEKYEKLVRAAGTYEGELTHLTDGRKYQVRLMIHIMKAGQNSKPYLSGSMWKLPTTEKEEPLDIARYSNGDYSPSSGTLFLYGSISNNAQALEYNLDGWTDGNTIRAIHKTTLSEEWQLTAERVH